MTRAVRRYEDGSHQPAPCECGGQWKLSFYDPMHGSDADGRRGWRLYVWECRRCGNEITIEEA